MRDYRMPDAETKKEEASKDTNKETEKLEWLEAIYGTRNPDIYGRKAFQAGGLGAAVRTVRGRNVLYGRLRPGGRRRFKGNPI